MLLGAELVRRRWPLLGGIGLLWAALGLFIFVDALDGVTLIPVSGFGTLIMVEGGMALLVAAGSTGAARRMRCAKGAGLLLIGFLAIETSGAAGDIALALLIGLGFMADGVLKIASARVVRFRGWRTAQAMGVLSLVLAAFTLQPWPTWYVGTIGCNVGIALFLSGLAAIVLANRLRRLLPGAPISELLDPAIGFVPPDDWDSEFADPGDLIVHVWTPVGTIAGKDRDSGLVRRAVVERYIAAVDRAGVVSTGHAALELGPSLYISHYPGREIERSPDSFRRILRATQDNDIPGVFKPGYAAEAAEWCASTHQVRFSRCDRSRLRLFWACYRMDDTYNLTSRNCSSVVIAALDAALEGALHAGSASPIRPWLSIVRAIWSPEFWAATVLRRRAETMAWTPGLVLDYARAMAAVVEPQEERWAARLSALRQVRRKSRR